MLKTRAGGPYRCYKSLYVTIKSSLLMGPSLTDQTRFRDRASVENNSKCLALD